MIDKTLGRRVEERNITKPQTFHACPQARSVTGLIRVPPLAVTLRMRLFTMSATNTFPLASMATPAGERKAAFVPKPSEFEKAPPPASVDTAAQLSVTTYITNANTNNTHHRAHKYTHIIQT